MSWKDTPVLMGKLATEADLVAGVAVFHQAGAGEPYSERQLPARAVASLDGEAGVNVTVVQIEVSAAGTIVCGAKPDDGSGDIVCLIEELEFLEGGK